MHFDYQMHYCLQILEKNIYEKNKLNSNHTHTQN